MASEDQESGPRQRMGQTPKKRKKEIQGCVIDMKSKKKCRVGVNFTSANILGWVSWSIKRKPKLNIDCYGVPNVRKHRT
ncbi:hypothetical protein ANCDUO_06569 [Ancylostoma duodenale]|uniref:Uncharacterized protein n=1 Tax=Ancylostoma duodenale TaxID=51022 RepID=A0A0C2D1A9_9BILA|nr:hypothetical protein ANCDUO_06569 [Ancylostoma duodenale]